MQTFSTDFGTSGVINGTYSGIQVNPADVFGGAGGNGNYPVTFTSAGYTLDLTTSLTSGINYFGFWLSVLDSGNIVTFLRAGTSVFQFTPTDLINLLGPCPNAFCGNPSPPFLGGDAGQLYAFLNFTDNSGAFDRIAFTENPMVGGYESDNQTVGFVTGTSGTPIPGPGTPILNQ